MSKLPSYKSTGTLDTRLPHNNSSENVAGIVANAFDKAYDVAYEFKRAEDRTASLSAINEYNTKFGELKILAQNDKDYRNSDKYIEDRNSLQKQYLELIPDSEESTKYKESLIQQGVNDDIWLKGDKGRKIADANKAQFDITISNMKRAYIGASDPNVRKGIALEYVRAFEDNSSIISPDELVDSITMVANLEKDRLENNVNTDPRGTISKIDSYNVSSEDKNNAIKTAQTLIKSQDTIITSIDPDTGDFYTPEQVRQYSQTTNDSFKIVDSYSSAIKKSNPTDYDKEVIKKIETPQMSYGILSVLTDLRDRKLITDDEYSKRYSPIKQYILNQINDNTSKGVFRSNNAIRKLNELVGNTDYDGDDKVKLWSTSYSYFDKFNISPNMSGDAKDTVKQIFENVEKSFIESKYPGFSYSGANAISSENGNVRLITGIDEVKKNGMPLFYNNRLVDDYGVKDYIEDDTGNIKYEAGSL